MTRHGTGEESKPSVSESVSELNDVPDVQTGQAAVGTTREGEVARQGGSQCEH